MKLKQSEIEELQQKYSYDGIGTWNLNGPLFYIPAAKIDWGEPGAPAPGDNCTCP